jgi:hypothetical protein
VDLKRRSGDDLVDLPEIYQDKTTCRRVFQNRFRLSRSPGDLWISRSSWCWLPRISKYLESPSRSPGDLLGEIKVTIAVNPAYTSQECSQCGTIVKKTLSNRTHACQCGCAMDRDHNAARNILSRGLSTVGHTGTFGLDPSNAWGVEIPTLVGANLPEQILTVNQESPSL